MSFLEPIVRELSQKFGLGTQAGALAMEALRAITNERGGGLAGFINRFQTAGFGSLVASWIGKGENDPVAPAELESALGSDFIATVASKVGLSASTAGAALAFVVPKLIDKLTPDGKVPSVLPPEVSALLGGGTARAVAADASPTGPSTAYAAAATTEDKPGGGLLRKLIPLLGLLLLGLLAYWLFGSGGEHTAKAPSATATAPSASAPAATATAPAKPDAAASARPSELALQNADGRILYSGTVPNGQVQSRIVDALNSVFGASAVTGSLGIDPAVAPPAWLDKLTAALGQFKIPGAEMLLKGDSVDVGGLLSDETKNTLIASLKSVFGDDFSVGKLTESLAGTLAAAKATIPAGAETPKAATTANPSQLALQNADGRILYAGTVPDGQTQSRIVDALNSVFGASAVSGSVAVDPAVAPPAWLDKLTAALGQFKIPGAEMLLKGDSIDIGGLLSDEAIGKLIASLKPIFGEEFSVDKLTESLAGTLAAAKAMVPTAGAPAPDTAGAGSGQGAPAANEKALAALQGLGSGYSAANLVEVLNTSVITFETGSAVISASDRNFLRTVANSISGAPEGSVLQIGGHTDNTGNADANLALSNARANAVRDALVGYGADPRMLVAEGFGGTKPIASNETPEGREQNRRIEFTVVK